MEMLLNFLLYLLIAGVILWGVQIVLGLIPIPAQIKMLILVIIGLVFLFWILRTLGIFVL